MNVELREGLLFTSIEIFYKGISKVIENVVIDTGAAETLILPDVVEEIGIIAELDDVADSFYGVGGSLHNFFSKKVEMIEFEQVKLYEVKLDFGVIDPKGRINGLLGLDLLIRLGVAIDFKSLELTIN